MALGGVELGGAVTGSDDPVAGEGARAFGAGGYPHWDD